MRDPETKKKLDARLNRIAGQVRGIQKMVDEDRYCVDILLQIAAARSALAKAGNLLLRSHIQTCVVETFSSDDPVEQDAKIQELIEVFDKYGQG
ncbi:MAG: metal-sensitive transcriptional regulator [Deltaproteobacteria bacterium]|nr:metal-sensitive transcriptional regulator [Deltaproteobacteria bacterium]